MSHRLKLAIHARDMAEAKVRLVLQNDYALGKPVQWRAGRGSVRQTGTVVGIDLIGDRVKVRNGSTDKEYWIYSSNVAEAAA